MHFLPSHHIKSNINQIPLLSLILGMANKTLSGWKKMTNYGFKLYVEQQPFPKVLIGFDLGLGNTGVSVTSSDLQHAYV
jgi:hypothetical protein